MRVRVVASLALALVALFGSWTVDALCATPRVRQSYDRLTNVQKTLYRQALQLAMDKGYYIKFVEMHTEAMSEMQAHRQCMFTYWHRYFLIGFENMLRSLGPEYECVTIPYWDEMQQNARALTGLCSSFETCAPIVRDMGASTSGPVKGIFINGVWVSGNRCVDSAPLNHFCEASSKTGSACARCLPRGSIYQFRSCSTAAL
jgi:tyrosinase